MGVGKPDGGCRECGGDGGVGRRAARTGCDVVTVQKARGRATPTITLNTYAHLWPTAEDKTRTAASGLMRTVLGNLGDSAGTQAN
jgi:hypothetical protein